MSENGRDNFSEKTKQLLASRAGWKCSYPKCGAATVGPSKEPSSKINAGIAAHICAASENGPRFDSSMTSEERKSIDNGIWMCRNHAHLIDANESNYTVEQLKAWKKDAEERAYNALSSVSNQAAKDEPYELNVTNHREGYGRYFKNPNDFSLYYSDKLNEYVLRGFDPIEIVLSEQFMLIGFNQYPETRARRASIERHEYVDRIVVDFYPFLDDVVRLYDPDATVEDFLFYYNVEGYFSITTSTSEACISGDFHFSSEAILDDLDRKVSPWDENIYNRIIQRLIDLKREIVNR